MPSEKKSNQNLTCKLAALQNIVKLEMNFSRENLRWNKS